MRTWRGAFGFLQESSTKKRIAFSALEFLYWAAMAAPSLTSMYLKEMGMSPSQIGTLSAFFACIGVFSPPFWGMVSDKMRSARGVFMVALILSCITWTLTPTAVRLLSVGMIWVMLPLSRFLYGGTGGLLDSWLVRTVSQERSLSYGSIRMFGSVGFMVAAVLYARAIPKFSVQVIFYGFALFAVPAVLMASRIKDDTQSTRSISFKEMSPGRLFKIAPYLAFLIFNVLLYMPTNAAFTFTPYLIQSVGGDPSAMATLIGVKAIVEVPLFLLSGKLLKRFKPTTLMIVAASFYVLEMLLCTMATQMWHIFALRCMQGTVYSMYLSSQIHYIHTLAPTELGATAQTLVGAGAAVADIIGNLAGGMIIQYVNLRAFYLCAAVVQGVAIGFLVLTLCVQKRKGGGVVAARPA